METSVSGERLPLVDALRGFALLGILIVNIMVFASPYYGQGIPDPNFQSTADKVVRMTVAVLFETKFYVTFSFLFGYSFTLLVRSLEKAGKSVAPHMRRRLAGLWIIGLGHGILLFYGDILATYAVVGAILLVMRNRRDRRLLYLVIWLIALPAVLMGSAGIFSGLDASYVDPVAVRGQVAETLNAYRGTVASVIMQNLSEFSWLAVGLVQGPTVLAIFFLGLLAGRHELLANADRRQPYLRWLLLGGIVIGLPGALAYGYCTVQLAGTGWEFLGLASSLLTGPFLSGAYVAGMILWFGTSSGGNAASWLAPAGRMALTNYLLQSLVCSVIFYAYGFRLMGEVGPAAAFTLALVIFLAQLGFSRWWMGRFAYGPVEWLLRALTNWQLPAFRRGH